MSNPASTRQVEFITDLLAKRQVPEAVAEGIKTRASADDLTSREASGMIDTLKTYSWKPRAAAPGFEAFDAVLATVPNSFYAIEFDLLPGFSGRQGNSDLLFVQIKKGYGNGRRYMKRLIGSVGGFSRSFLTPADSLLVIEQIAKNPVEAARTFGKHYSVCGCCGAELTDEESRRTQFGPVCRKNLAAYGRI